MTYHPVRPRRGQAWALVAVWAVASAGAAMWWGGNAGWPAAVVVWPLYALLLAAALTPRG